ncbi:hypothetical protein HNQ86_000189 [Oleiagrimonas soli]|uniref:Uncharacterized protein n=1 Tax=Oleiagrimonas soli TaxID=1543381 RepID=A0A841KLI7_9GAMM|nr:hypothetical protein [Oleiagrimonas soli]
MPANAPLGRAEGLPARGSHASILIPAQAGIGGLLPAVESKSPDSCFRRKHVDEQQPDTGDGCTNRAASVAPETSPADAYRRHFRLRRRRPCRHVLPKTFPHADRTLRSSSRRKPESRVSRFSTTGKSSGSCVRAKDVRDRQPQAFSRRARQCLHPHAASRQRATSRFAHATAAATFLPNTQGDVLHRAVVGLRQHGVRMTTRISPTRRECSVRKRVRRHARASAPSA